MLDLEKEIGERFAAALESVAESARGELRAQGHKASGRGIESVESKVTAKNIDLFKGHVEANDYLVFQDTGVTATRIRVPISALVRWLGYVAPGLDKKQATARAWAIRTVMQREGMPTRGAYSYTQNGRRTEWIKYGIEAFADEFERILDIASPIEQVLSDLQTQTTR